MRGDKRIYKNNASLGGLPVYSWPGTVNFTDVSPNWIMLAARNFTLCLVTQADDQDVLAFEILVNEIAVESVGTSATYFQAIPIVMSTVQYDNVRLDLTGFGTGQSTNLTVALY